MTHAVDVGYGVQADASPRPAASTMVYEAANIPPYTNFWIVTGFPKGVVDYTWTAAPGGRVHRPQGGIPPADHRSS